MLHLSTLIQHYKREDIQKEILENAKNREIAFKFGDKGFGKRPDTIKYPNDILELAKQNATSFHASEELWTDPSRVDPLLKRKQLDELRKGWDLVLDIDCKDWQFSKLTTLLFIKALKDHNVKSISCKFSGNKGFHIGVPFEAFPSEVEGKKTKDLFPEGPRRIAEYLLNFISDNYVKENNKTISFINKYSYSLDSLKEKFGDKEFMIKTCRKCGNKVNPDKEKINEFICPNCDKRVKGKHKFIKCDKCNVLMERIPLSNSLCDCGSNSYESKFNPLSIIEVDTVLIASRHLYRMSYCFNEKSELISIPIDPDKVMEFDKKQAEHPIKLPPYKFLDRTNVIKGEARGLIVQAFDYTMKKKEQQIERVYEDLTESIPQKFFPPCIKIGLKGLKDGRKRFLFCLLNFLVKAGYDYEKIDEIVHEWNKKNPEQLRETHIIGPLRYHKQKKEKILPPNCRNYYNDLQICQSDNLCEKIKNPVSYAIRKTGNLKK